MMKGMNKYGTQMAFSAEGGSGVQDWQFVSANWPELRWQRGDLHYTLRSIGDAVSNDDLLRIANSIPKPK